MGHFPQNQGARHRYITTRIFDVVLLLTVIFGGILQYFAAYFNTLSPFISDPHEFAKKEFYWIYKHYSANLSSQTPDKGVEFFYHFDNYFRFDFLFAFFLCLLLYSVFAALHYSHVNNKMRVFRFDPVKSCRKLFEKDKSKYNAPLNMKVFIITLGVAFIFDYLEGGMFLKNYAAEDQTRDWLLKVNSLKFLFYGLVVLQIIVARIMIFEFDFRDDEPLSKTAGSYFVKLVKYFYPALINIGILAYIFTTYDTFDHLILSLEDDGCFNKMLFGFMFAFTILQVWFIPYFLRHNDGFHQFLLNSKLATLGANTKIIFRDLFFFDGTSFLKRLFLWKSNIYYPIERIIFEVNDKSNRDKPKSGFFTFFQKRYVKSRIVQDVEKNNSDDLQELEKEYVQYLENNDSSDANFSVLRRSFGFWFFIILIGLECHALDSLLGSNFVKPIVITLELLGMYFFLTGYLNCIKGKKHITRTNYKWYKALFWVLVISTVLLFVSPAFNFSTAVYIAWLILNSVLFSFVFMGFAIYRRILARYNFVMKIPKPGETTSKKSAQAAKSVDIEGSELEEEEKDQPGYISCEQLNDEYKYWELHIGTVAIPWYLKIFFWLLFPLMVACYFNPNCLEFINPLNLYLVIINSVIVFIAVIGRVAATKFRRIQFDLNHGLHSPKDNYKKEFRSAVTLMILLYLIAPQADENKFHDVDFIPKSKSTDMGEPDSISEYLATFLKNNPDETKPIYLIAADGGGLRAAYWTMLIMNGLENKDPGFYKRVFLNTGVSGGGIGLGMYTYLKSKSEGANSGQFLNNRKLIGEKMEAIGRTNFLNGDLGGMFGKELPSRLLPTSWKLNCMEDRHEAMAKHYFKICSDDGTDTEYKSLREQPFFKLWKNSKTHLPILTVNTARTEDGMRGVVHPLTYDLIENAPYVDLSRNYQGEHISYPDALFLTNRFPLISPAARIEGKGHFVDGGYLENSALSTIFYYLLKIKTGADTSEKINPADTMNIYRQFLNRKIVVISIKNDKSNYINSKFSGTTVKSVGW